MAVCEGCRTAVCGLHSQQVMDQLRNIATVFRELESTYDFSIEYGGVSVRGVGIIAWGESGNWEAMPSC